ncbi:hypothetical protein ILFOPFJJ_05327 [Ensifer psoraleae]|nr:hypothetical protein [Sinorhizobium psoraleae]
MLAENRTHFPSSRFEFAMKWFSQEGGPDVVVRAAMTGARPLASFR